MRRSIRCTLASAWLEESGTPYEFLNRQRRYNGVHTLHSSTFDYQSPRFVSQPRSACDGLKIGQVRHDESIRVSRGVVQLLQKHSKRYILMSYLYSIHYQSLLQCSALRWIYARLQPSRAEGSFFTSTVLSGVFASSENGTLAFPAR